MGRPGPALLVLAGLLAGLPVFTAAARAEGELEVSAKKTLFVFPVQYGPNAQGVPAARQRWIGEQFFETFVTGFERFDFIEMTPDADIDRFLENSDAYLREHARDLVQRRKEPDGRIGEARVTLDDLVRAVQGGYAFVPVFDKVKRVKDEKDNVTFEIAAHLDIYRTADRAKVGTVYGSTEGVGGLIGAMTLLTETALKGPGAQRSVERTFRRSVVGVFEEMKTHVRKLEEFSLKAVVTSSASGRFTFDLGRNFGVKLDRRYMVWRLDPNGNRTKMLAFGKARRIGPARSTAQILIGTASEGDQVVEAAAFGLNISPTVGIIPLETSGFDWFRDHEVIFFGGPYTLPVDRDAMRPLIGVTLEYNVAWLTGVSELYTIMDGGWVPVGGLIVFNGMIGLEKKVYLRRLALLGAVKYGVFGVNFIDHDLLEDESLEEAEDARVWGIGADVGAELLLSPNLALQGRLGWVGFPEQTVLRAIVFGGQPFIEYRTASVRAVGFTTRVSLVLTL